ncbi:Putative regulator of cell autolysis [Aquiflexum balticum DSM 16537]|uniref:Putative regulator of cell autolysis n=1 Tax=Aquiflexum balticum DSM 16537 TaxID=758820 RepID=A0A1W2H8B4_9BACT|nr:histidine kinase [Aquiflexum balticum]SMD45133.1 Putative regulator of cell autolysis [Aquiflexum balticum DSM 16537]
MKDSPLPFRQIEWWIVTLVFLSIILINILNAGFIYYKPTDQQIADYFAKLFIPVIHFLSFYFIHMKIIPGYSRERKPWKYALLLALLFFGSFILSVAFSTGAEITDDFFMPFYLGAIAIYAGYLLLTYILDQILTPPRLGNYILFNIIRLFAIYLFVILFLIQFQKFGTKPIILVFAVVIPSIVFIILFNFFLIYGNRKKGKTQMANYFLALLEFSIALIFLIVAIQVGTFAPAFVGLAAMILVAVVLVPASNLIFEKYDAYLGEINSLSTKVTQSNANLDFLRSQINPHFLFNALNTLYGTALQENAERTSEGIQKLGDMMRFMLHENNQDKIPVEREKEYLVNYVDLQLLRIKEQENIDIVFSKGEDACSGEIAPMLLIPFVENAFKHGISLQKKSWVKISLRCLAGSVHLDVNNSIHRSDEHDPERKSSGIGLENVRQRLDLLYPGKHDLVIRENEMEYFVHLSIKL